MVIKNKEANRLMIVGVAMLVMLFSSWGLLSPSTSASGFADGIDAVKEVGGLSQKEVQPTNLVTTGLYWLMYGIGIISVVMIIIGGIRYATSGGNAEKVKSAKNTILYAVVGLAVALLALAIVNFVQTQTGLIGGNGDGGGGGGDGGGGGGGGEHTMDVFN